MLLSLIYSDICIRSDVVQVAQIDRYFANTLDSLTAMSISKYESLTRVKVVGIIPIRCRH